MCYVQRLIKFVILNNRWTIFIINWQEEISCSDIYCKVNVYAYSAIAHHCEDVSNASVSRDVPPDFPNLRLVLIHGGMAQSE